MIQSEKSIRHRELRGTKISLSCSWPHVKYICVVKTCIEKQRAAASLYTYLYLCLLESKRQVDKTKVRQGEKMHFLQAEDSFSLCACVAVCCCGSMLIMTLVSKCIEPVLCAVTRASQRCPLNPFHLIQGSYHRRYEETLVISVPFLSLCLFLSLSGALSNGTAREGDTVPAPCTKQCTDWN